ncbi:tRNA adenosine(34) deaminase TadA [Thermotalea metallivorans]|uniref:tRNA-specific adenosine deaminase n=1 Tax=Thermotalea metallivorans TaxID=520762 RepID=A0A140L3V6_9FIRM|nr:tRNA adenosine(34) deaminase TadA [Thermotalea metallivorans]KXG75231.1 tRNA-specific adenosine deaminase [Thermotalea metallivorans]
MEEYFMGEALREAQKAFDLKEVPIGAVVVKDGNIIGRGYNLRETLKDPTAHAEILAIRQASQTLGGWRLYGCDLYVTIEPCPMCAGAILLSRINRLIIGAMDPKGGAAGSLLNIPEDGRFNHHTEVIQGVLEEECSAIMKVFFQELRKNK